MPPCTTSCASTRPPPRQARQDDDERVPVSQRTAACPSPLPSADRGAKKKLQAGKCANTLLPRPHPTTPTPQEAARDIPLGDQGPPLLPSPSRWPRVAPPAAAACPPSSVPPAPPPPPPRRAVGAEGAGTSGSKPPSSPSSKRRRSQAPRGPRPLPPPPTPPPPPPPPPPSPARLHPRPRSSKAGARRTGLPPRLPLLPLPRPSRRATARRWWASASRYVPSLVPFPFPSPTSPTSPTQVWWPEDEEFYAGTITAFSSTDGKHTVTYDDGEVRSFPFPHPPTLPRTCPCMCTPCLFFFPFSFPHPPTHPPLPGGEHLPGQGNHPVGGAFLLLLLLLLCPSSSSSCHGAHGGGQEGEEATGGPGRGGE